MGIYKYTELNIKEKDIDTIKILLKLNNLPITTDCGACERKFNLCTGIKGFYLPDFPAIEFYTENGTVVAFINKENKLLFGDIKINYA